MGGTGAQTHGHRLVMHLKRDMERSDPRCGSVGSPTVVVLTRPCSKAVRILDGLADRGILVAAVILRRSEGVWRLFPLLRCLGLRRVARICASRAHAEVFQPRSANWRRADAYRARAGRVFEVPDLNGDECVRILARLAPDIAVIGCAGILRTPVFEIPRLGVLNVHLGLVPDYRGNSTVEWSVLEGADVGVTLHFIDAGIDTGPVIAQRTVPVQEGDDFAKLSRRVGDAGIDLLVSCLEGLVGGESIRGIPQKPSGKHAYGIIPPHLQRVVYRKLKERASREQQHPHPS